MRVRLAFFVVLSLLMFLEEQCGNAGMVFMAGCGRA